MIIVWFYKSTMNGVLQSLYVTDMDITDIRRAFKKYGEDGGPFFMQAEHLTDKFLQPIVDSDVDGDEMALSVIDFFLTNKYIDYMVNMSYSDTEPVIGSLTVR